MTAPPTQKTTAPNDPLVRYLKPTTLALWDSVKDLMQMATLGQLSASYAAEVRIEADLIEAELVRLREVIATVDAPEATR